MFVKYDGKTRRRIYSLLSRTLDNNVKLGIDEPLKITDNFIKEIRGKKMATWTSLVELCDSKYFHDECVKYVTEKIGEYKSRYGPLSSKGKISEGQLGYLADMIERSLKHPDYLIRVNSKAELKNIITLLSKSSAGIFIEKYREILGENLKEKIQVTPAKPTK